MRLPNSLSTVTRVREAKADTLRSLLLRLEQRQAEALSSALAGRREPREDSGLRMAIEEVEGMLKEIEGGQAA